LLVLSSYVPKELRSELEKSGLFIWDRNDLWDLIKFGLQSSRLLDELEQLLNEAQQGFDTEDVFVDVQRDPRVPDQYFERLMQPFRRLAGSVRHVRRKDYCAELNAIAEGRPGWRAYGQKCIEILKLLFPNDLTRWSAQHVTDDGLGRFDMICRNIAGDDFWKSLIQSFQSRYILFEFKNYTEPIGQDQIYTTERYLYLKGLRAVGFIIARKGGNQQAIKAAKGALKEHGKLILVLDNDDLCKMLEMKADSKIPSDHLSEKLDNFLISLSR
jgi:hypothetical protein